MERETLTPKADWMERVRKYGFDIHHFDGIPYWAEDTAYKFSAAQIDELDDATTAVHQLCLQAVDKIVRDYRAGNTRLIGQYSIDPKYWPAIAESWERGDKGVYGRFDFAYDGKSAPKMLEYNADTPTSLMEAAVVQWYWKEDYKPEADQFNSVHETLIDHWNSLASRDANGRLRMVYFAGCTEVREDMITLEYMRDTAEQAGLPTKTIDISDITYDYDKKRFIDPDGTPINNCFKLYPWEHMVADEFGELAASSGTNWIEPMWKMLLSNKAILPVLWELFPDHPNLVKASFKAEDFAGQDHVIKPKLSREGANVKIVLNGMAAQHTQGIYNEADSIYQAYAPMPKFTDATYGEVRPVLGTWMVGDKSCGMGIREARGFVTDNDSRFVPHYFTP
jgi:glutathionylspermidine synthase